MTTPESRDRAAIEAEREKLAKAFRILVLACGGVATDERVTEYLDTVCPLPPEPRGVTFTTRYGSTVTLTERRHGYDVAFAGSGIRSTVGTLLDALTSSAPSDTDLPRIVNTFLGTPAPERFESTQLFTNRYECGYARGTQGTADQAREVALSHALETAVELYRKVAT